MLTAAHRPQNQTSRRTDGFSRRAVTSATSESSVAAAPNWKLIAPWAMSSGPGWLIPKPQAGLNNWKK